MLEFSPEHLVQIEIIVSILVALILGGMIGIERETANKPAGLRTHMLVAGASTLIVDLGFVAVGNFAEATAGSVVQADPLRIIEAVVAGISFLGAGTILRRGDDRDVEGLTTAASILFTAAVGVSVALAQYVVAVGATLLALLTLRIIYLTEDRLRTRRSDDT